MSGSLIQYTCCDWDIIDIKLAIISQGKSVMCKIDSSNNVRFDQGSFCIRENPARLRSLRN